LIKSSKINRGNQKIIWKGKLNDFRIRRGLDAATSQLFKWKTDGVTTMVGLETENNKYTKLQLRAAAKAIGLSYMDLL